MSSYVNGHHLLGAVWVMLPASLARNVHCGCGELDVCVAPGQVAHRITCAQLLMALPQLMVDPDGALIVPPVPEDAVALMDTDTAQPLYPDRFYRWLSEVDGVAAVAPVTGAEAYAEMLDDRPEGCICYLREDVEYGEVWTPPNGGCPAHPSSLRLQMLPQQQAGLQ